MSINLDIRGPVFYNGNFLMGTIIASPSPHLAFITVSSDSANTECGAYYNVDSDLPDNMDIGIFSFPREQINGEIQNPVKTDTGFTFLCKILSSTTNNLLYTGPFDSNNNRRFLVTGNTPIAGSAPSNPLFILTQSTANQWNYPQGVIGYCGIPYSITSSDGEKLRVRSDFIDTVFLIPAVMFVKTNNVCGRIDTSPQNIAKQLLCNVNTFFGFEYCNTIPSNKLVGWSTNDDCLDGQYTYCAFPAKDVKNTICGNCKGPCPNNSTSTINQCLLNEDGTTFTCSVADLPPEEIQWWKTPMFIGSMIGLLVIIVIIVLIVIALLFLHKKKKDDE